MKVDVDNVFCDFFNIFFVMRIFFDFVIEVNLVEKFVDEIVFFLVCWVICIVIIFGLDFEGDFINLECIGWFGFNILVLVKFYIYFVL